MKQTISHSLRRLGALMLASVTALSSAAVIGSAMALTSGAASSAASSADVKGSMYSDDNALFASSTVSAEKDSSSDPLGFDENIMLSIFWPPTPNYINDEQYQLIADAGVNWILGAGEETLATAANQKKMLELCEKYGIKLIVQDGNFGGGLVSKREAAIKRQVDKYTDYEALGGFYILDEPYNANAYVDAYLALKKAFPAGYMHLNFLPSGAYGSDAIYRAQLNDWCRLCANGGYPVDYLIYDRYPFGLAAGSMDRNGFYANLRAVHDVGLENGVRTGTYIQTVCQEVAFRRPTDSEIRFEMYSALAFGFKQLSFFTWFTPVNRSEPFRDGIISADGKPNAHYEAIKTINHEILAIGPILAKCEALEIYLNGDTYGQPSIPDDFFAQPATRGQSYTLSWLRHKETGRNYLMVVNNNFSREQTISLDLDPDINALYEVSRTDATLSPLSITNRRVKFTLSAGDAILLALPEGMDFLEMDDSQPTAEVNLALDGQITCSESPGSFGYYMCYLNDGIRFSDGNTMGWRSNGTAPSYIILDLKHDFTFNRLDLYPEGTLFTFGDNMPSDFSISVSSDGSTYKEVAAVAEYTDGVPLSVTFDAVKGRYIRIDVTQCNGSFASFCEIEVYNDNGSVPAPEVYAPLSNEDKVIVYQEGADLALKKPVYPSSTTPEAGYRSWGWAADFINNGETTNGWTSNVKIHNSADSTEYMIIDLEDIFAVNQVVVSTLGLFPVDFRIEMSTDGKNWSPIVSVVDSSAYESGTKLTFEPESGEPVVGRFLRFIATKLRSSAVDGYMLQLGNISAYGTPVCDRSVLTDAMARFQKLGGDVSEEAYVQASAALEETYLTQSQAKSYAKALLALVHEPETEPETEPITEPETETEPVTDPVDTGTQPPVDSETDTVDTSASEQTTQSTETGSSGKTGCASSLGGAALAGALAVSAAALAIGKKKKER